MMAQWTKPHRSLAEALEELRAGELKELLSLGSRKVRHGRISGNTGGYSQARKRLEVGIVEAVVDRLNGAIQAGCQEETIEGYKVYIIDGSTIRIAHTAANLGEYPQYHNQYGKAHYPIVRIGVATDAHTGVVVRPSYGAYNGKNATSELRLTEEILERLPQGSVVIGDRYFGCPWFAASVLAHGHEIICRVKDSAAKRIIGNVTSAHGEVETEWKTVISRIPGKVNHPPVKGRIIWHTMHRRGFRPLRLILFTTLSLPRKKIIELYGLRWNVETDLRSIKTTLQMEMLQCKTPNMIAKEIILGVCAYNLIRHFMLGIARSLRASPRELSFSRTLALLQALASLDSSPTAQLPSLDTYKKLLSDPAYLLLPRRKKTRPAEPRKVWRHGRISFMSDSRSNERAKLQQPNNFSNAPK
jgi:hypothetical protein